MAKPHVCSRLVREIKACQEKPGRGGGVGTGRDGMNKRRVQAKSGLLGLSTISCRVLGVFLIQMQGSTVRRRRRKKKKKKVYIGLNSHHRLLTCDPKICSPLLPSSHLSPDVMAALILESCWCFKLLTSQRRFFCPYYNLQ